MLQLLIKINSYIFETLDNLYENNFTIWRRTERNFILHIFE